MSEPSLDTPRRRAHFEQFRAICRLSGIEFDQLDLQSLEPVLNGDMTTEAYIELLKQQFTRT
jgi:hypothetical protein